MISTCHLSPTLLNEVHAAMPADTYVASKELWRQMKRWAPGTIRHALRHLYAAGKLDREIKKIPGDCVVHLYRKKQG